MKLKWKFSLHSKLFLLMEYIQLLRIIKPSERGSWDTLALFFPLVVYIHQGNGNFYCLTWYEQNSDWHLLCCSAILTSLLLASPTRVMNGKNFLFFFSSEGRESLKLSGILSWSVISLSFYSITNEERIWEVTLLYAFRIFVSG